MKIILPIHHRYFVNMRQCHSACAKYLESVLIKAESFVRLIQLTVAGWNSDWTEQSILTLLTRPTVQRIPRFNLNLTVWMHFRSVLSALFLLPSRTYLHCTIGSISARWIKSDLMQSQQLTSIDVQIAPEHVYLIRALRYAPAVTQLTLLNSSHGYHSFEPIIWCMPPTLHSLALFSFAQFASRAVLKTFFQHLPLLREFCTCSMEGAPLLQGVIDAGTVALPHLRRITFSDMPVKDFTSVLLARFLHRFPMVCISIRADNFDPAAEQLSFEIGGWSRVEFRHRNFNSFPNAGPLMPAEVVGAGVHETVESISDPGSDVDADEESNDSAVNDDENSNSEIVANDESNDYASSGEDDLESNSAEESEDD